MAVTYTVETYKKGDPDWEERHRCTNADAAFELANEFTEQEEYNGIRVITIIGRRVWRSIRIDYDYMHGRKERGQ